MALSGMTLVCHATIAASNITPTPMATSSQAGCWRMHSPRPVRSAGEAKILQNARDACDLFAEELAEFGARQIDAGPVLLLELGLPRRSLDHAVDHVHQRLLLIARDAGPTEHAAPVEELDVDALL